MDHVGRVWLLLLKSLCGVRWPPQGGQAHLAYGLVRSVRPFFGREHALVVDLHLAQVLGAVGECHGHLRRWVGVSRETHCNGGMELAFVSGLKR